MAYTDEIKLGLRPIMSEDESHDLEGMKRDHARFEYTADSTMRRKILKIGRGFALHIIGTPKNLRTPEPGASFFGSLVIVDHRFGCVVCTKTKSRVGFTQVKKISTLVPRVAATTLLHPFKMARGTYDETIKNSVRADLTTLVRCQVFYVSIDDQLPENIFFDPYHKTRTVDGNAFQNAVRQRFGWVMGEDWVD